MTLPALPLRALLLSLLLAITLGLAPPARAQWTPTTDSAHSPPVLPREFRGLWVATVANIDWPSARGLPVADLRREMHLILDTARDRNFNAVVFQVRPACDALYESALEPWSEFLTGESGKPILDESGKPFDALREWTAAAHARGLELHAWINPFRARHFESKKPDAPTHVSRAHPDWVRTYDQYLWLDPGVPEAREHSLAVALDIVNRYDIDGIHFDDYFYPYPKDKVPFPDDASHLAARAAAPPPATADTPPVPAAREDWRRQNINTFVHELYGRVKQAKRHVKVGVSPFGIWRPGQPPGVVGFDAYAQLYADARLWLRNGWLDYCSPQLYWPIESKGQPYARLLDWWTDQNDQQRHLWPGLNASRVLAEGALAKDGKPAPSWEPAQILAQIDATRRAAAGGTSGNILFSAVAVSQNRRRLGDALAETVFANPAAVPASTWLSTGETDPVVTARVVQNDQGTHVFIPATSTARWWVIRERRAGSWSLRTCFAAALERVDDERGSWRRIRISGPGSPEFASGDILAVQPLDASGGVLLEPVAGSKAAEPALVFLRK